MGRLSDLPNIGADTERLLNATGILTPEELYAAGAKNAWLRILAVDNSACLHRLYALEGAVRGINKSLLDDDIKAELKAFCNEMKAK